MTSNKYLSSLYYDLTPDEREDYMWRLANALIKHKCLYYMFDIIEVNDCEYDYIERVYEAVCKDLGQEPVVSNMVGFDNNIEECYNVYQKLLKQKGKDE